MVWVIKFIGWIAIGDAIRQSNMWIGLVGVILIEGIYKYLKDIEQK